LRDDRFPRRAFRRAENLEIELEPVGARQR
jgi:hypothetical protein